MLFHPFLPLLFDRLDLRADRTTLAAHGLPRAAAALAALAASGPRDGPLDPLERLLLALPDGIEPDPAPLAPAETALIEGLLRSVIAQWRRLGQTSPEGLRETFVRRRGVLERRAPDPPRLFVDKGPFDMLLDGLPWSLTQVALPWMALPLSVSWRERRD